MKIQTKIANLVTKETGCDIFSSKKTQEIVDARALYEYILREEYKLTLKQIQDYYRSKGKKRHHSTILYNVKLFKNDIRYRRPQFENFLEFILQTEITPRQRDNAYRLVNKLTTQKQLKEFRKLINNIIK